MGHLVTIAMTTGGALPLIGGRAECGIKAGSTVCSPQLPGIVYVLQNLFYRCAFKAKFHYAVLVADRSEAGCRPVADLLARASSLPAS